MVLRAWVEDDGGGGLRVRIMKSSDATRSETETLTVASIEDASAAVRDWLEALCERLAEGGDYAGAIEAGLAAVRDEPLRESSHRALIRAHLAEGNSSEALRQYGIFRGMLRNELGLDPSPRMEALLLGVTHQ